MLWRKQEIDPTLAKWYNNLTEHQQNRRFWVFRRTLYCRISRACALSRLTAGRWERLIRSIITSRNRTKSEIWTVPENIVTCPLAYPRSRRYYNNLTEHQQNQRFWVFRRTLYHQFEADAPRLRRILCNSTAKLWHYIMRR